MSIHIINGDLFETTAKYICHQVNCKGKMGSGVAKQIRERYPEVYSAYRLECNLFDEQGNPRDLLGSNLPVQADDGKIICNMFAQNAYGYDGACYTDYEAFRMCLIELAIYVPAGDTIAMPYKIGCGLGGGDWSVIEGLISTVLGDRFIVELWRKE